MVQLSDALQYAWAQIPSRHVIVPSINPTKTWEGLLGGSASVTLIGGVLWWATPFQGSNWWMAAAMSLVISVMGFAGGLTLSAIKRDRGVRDYGTLVEGHGGLLDRIDSLCFSAPVFFHFTLYWLKMQGVKQPWEGDAIRVEWVSKTSNVRCPLSRSPACDSAPCSGRRRCCCHCRITCRDGSIVGGRATCDVVACDGCAGRRPRRAAARGASCVSRRACVVSCGGAAAAAACVPPAAAATVRLALVVDVIDQVRLRPGATRIGDRRSPASGTAAGVWAAAVITLLSAGGAGKPWPTQATHVFCKAGKSLML